MPIDALARRQHYLTHMKESFDGPLIPRKDTERVISLSITLGSMIKRSSEGLHDLASLHIERIAIGEAPVDCGAPSADPIR